MRTDGLPGFEISKITDLSTVPSTLQKGLTVLVGVTEFAQAGKPVLVNTPEAYSKNFGVFVSKSQFEIFCKILLDNNIPFVVSPVHAYSDPSDKTTLLGTKALRTVANAITPETLAGAMLDITATGAAGDKISVYANTLTGPVFLGIATVPATPTLTTVASAVVTAINALTSSGYTAISMVGSVAITGPTGSGSLLNGRPLIVDITGGTAFTAANFANGVSALGLSAFVVRAKAVGPAFNEAKVKVTAALSGDTDLVDLTILFRGETYLVSDINKATPDVELINGVLETTLFEVLSATSMGIMPYTSLASGAENKNLVENHHYAGNPTGKTGVFSALATQADAICVPGKPVELINKALEQFVTLKPGIEGVVSTPIGIDGDAVLNYRNGISLGKINTFRMAMTTGGIRVISPFTGAKVIVSEMLQDIYSRFKGFNTVGPHVGIADPEFAAWTIPQSVVEDFCQVDTRIVGDTLARNGINCWTLDDTDGVVPNGNNTLQVAKSLLSKRNIANYIMQLEREFPGIVKSAKKKFKPNNPEAWLAVYNAVSPYMEAGIKSSAIFAYAYVGDQFATSVDQAVINTPVIVNAGNHIFKLFIYPTSLLERIACEIVITGSTAQIKVLTESL